MSLGSLGAEATSHRRERDMKPGIVIAPLMSASPERAARTFSFVEPPASSGIVSWLKEDLLNPSADVRGASGQSGGKPQDRVWL